jgi:septal ring factor EnvC (AmiA/AmiB activator)
MKRLQGLIAATFITAIVAVGTVGIGVNALSNPNTVAVSNSPASNSPAQVSSKAATDQTSAEIDQMQNLIKQYQSREQQYQTEIKSLSQKLSDANATAEQAQQVLQALQERGIIQITRDGRIFLRGD